MRIFIITMDDPVQTYDFIKHIIDKKRHQVVGIAVPNGNRLTLAKGKSKKVYVLSLLLIMGVFPFIKSANTIFWYRLKKELHRFGLAKDPSIMGYAKSKGIPTQRIQTPNGKAFRAHLASLDLDVIINQSQSFIKQELLDIPKIGVLNRHNALLPRNRGRLTPFWVKYHNDGETGVSIHFVEASLDSGDIIIQKKFPVESTDTFNTIVKKNYQLAPHAMIEALDFLEEGKTDFIENDDDQATYNTTPTFKEALDYRMKIRYKRK